jgi:hypothetical protein
MIVMALLWAMALPKRAHCQTIPAAVATSLQIEDLMQTRWFLSRGVQEGNPLLGAHPSTIRLLAWHGAWIASYWCAPKRIRLVWDVFWAGNEFAAVLINSRLKTPAGVPIGWRFDL